MTFLIVGSNTSCADCGEVLHSQSWTARTAHVCSRRTRLERAETLCGTTCLDEISGVETYILKGHKAAPITSRGLTAKTSEES